MSREFYGIYAPYLKELVELKRSLGFKYICGEFVFSVFDRFTIERNETTIGITKELSDTWCQRRDNESNSYHYRRCFLLSSLSSFLCKKGIRSYVPQLPPVKNTFVPYIFSRKEMDRIFAACDNMQSGNNDMRSPIFTMPALIRTLYGTGIRIGEALALTNENVNLQDRYFILKDTKNGIDRLVPFSASLSEVLKSYVLHKNKLPTNISDKTPFFVTLRGACCNGDVIYRRFCKILTLAKIHKDRIRLHDVRHTFSVHSLAMMVEAGMDIYCSLPILSTYLGHQSIRATNNYVRLTSEMYPELIRKIDIISFNIFPKISQL
ncbi:MAG: tyrosine-type recombinase/integrase [Mangrovibacterium sp.]